MPQTPPPLNPEQQCIWDEIHSQLSDPQFVRTTIIPIIRDITAILETRLPNPIMALEISGTITASMACAIADPSITTADLALEMGKDISARVMGMRQ